MAFPQGERLSRIMAGKPYSSSTAANVAALPAEEKGQLGQLLDNLGQRINDATGGLGEEVSKRTDNLVKGGKDAYESAGRTVGEVKGRSGNIINALGELLRDTDRAYAQGMAEVDMFNRPGMTTPILSRPATVPYADRTDLSELDRLDRARVANIISRYALPAGGVTLAGVGLMDIVDMLDGDR